MTRAPAIYFGQVMHLRQQPAHNRFLYRVFFLRCRLADLDRLQSRLLSRNRWNLFSLHDADYGPRDGTPLEPWLRRLLAAHGVHNTDGDIELQTFPRVLGYVFNPISFWLCRDRAGGLRAVLCEVSNTFGEHHNYLIKHDDGRVIGARDWLTARKVFHVSPFFEVSGDYRFRFADADGACSFRVDYHDHDHQLLQTSVGGRARPLTTAHLLTAFISYPWMTLAVIARIHYQALKLWLKRVRFVSKPIPPIEETTR
jgi:DUF1365 family protein